MMKMKPYEIVASLRSMLACPAGFGTMSLRVLPDRVELMVTAKPRPTSGYSLIAHKKILLSDLEQAVDPDAILSQAFHDLHRQVVERHQRRTQIEQGDI